ncbi:MAG: CpsD/CapB family tyrosine-protein kinase [Acidobacteriia bacterium]|nr:CpsD/CapB family tyrosine-protein kinase [Terriglobia bacterium]
MAGVPAAPAVAQPLIHETALPEIVPPVAPAASPVVVRADAAQPLSWELISARCPQRAWTPAKGMLFLNGNSHDQVGTEEFRTLRSRLYHVREKRPLKTILVCSALPAEGKTFVSANLAQTLARQHGRRVVILDCDLRRARLHESFGTASEPGISDYLHGDADEFSILQRGPMENLAFIPGGRQMSNPAELIGNGRLELLLKRLGDIFEWIVIDSPPAVPVADASLIGRYCDGILLVVMAAKTPFDLAQRARHEFRNMPVLGVVLNRVEAGSTYVSYYYGAYGQPGGKAPD